MDIFVDFHWYRSKVTLITNHVYNGDKINVSMIICGNLLPAVDDINHPQPFESVINYLSEDKVVCPLAVWSLIILGGKGGMWMGCVPLSLVLCIAMWHGLDLFSQHSKSHQYSLAHIRNPKESVPNGQLIFAMHDAKRHPQGCVVPLHRYEQKSKCAQTICNYPQYCILLIFNLLAFLNGHACNRYTLRYQILDHLVRKQSWIDRRLMTELVLSEYHLTSELLIPKTVLVCWQVETWELTFMDFDRKRW